MDEKQELIEIYKLHAELADNVSARRGTANRFYMLVCLEWRSSFQLSYNAKTESRSECLW